MQIITPVRADRRSSFELAAGATRVFPLFCPVREREWVAGWDPLAVHSKSGLIEPDCVFITQGAAREQQSTWVVVEHDVAAGRTAMISVTPGELVKRVEIAVVALSAERSRVDVRYALTALDARGKDAVARFDEQALAGLLEGWRAGLALLVEAKPAEPAAKPLSRTPADILVEVKALLEPTESKRLRELLAMDAPRRARQVTFFDTPGQDLLARGVILRFRQTETGSGLRSQSTAKLRPREVLDIPGAWRDVPGFKGEIDRVGEQVVPSVALTEERSGKRFREWVAVDDISPEELFGAEQRRFVAELTGKPIDFGALRPYGPIEAGVWRAKVRAFQPEVSIERWKLGEDLGFLELSFRASLAEADAAVALLERWVETSKLQRAGQQTKTKSALGFFAGQKPKRRP